jgi:hypothetical protein
MKLVDFNSLTNFGIEDPRMTTIGGVLFRHLDRLPQAGDEVKVEDFWMTVLEVQEQRIARVRVARGDRWKEEQGAGEGSGTVPDQSSQAPAPSDADAPPHDAASDRQPRGG